MEGQPVALILLAAAVPLLAQPDATSLLRRMSEAENLNRKQAAYFVYREDIRNSVALDGQLPRLTNWVTYEVIFLEGEAYHRPIARNGRPLPPDERAAEEKRLDQVSEYRRRTPMEERRKRFSDAEENRYKIDSQVALEFHEAVILGEDTIRGRRVWLLATKPRRNAPKPKRRADWSLSQRLTYWVDQETFLPLRIEAEQLYDYDSTRKGAITRVETVEVEGTLLPSRITVSSQARRHGMVTATTTDQSYSDYRRFRTESVFVFEDSDPEKP